MGIELTAFKLSKEIRELPIKHADRSDEEPSDSETDILEDDIILPEKETLPGGSEP